MLSKKKASRGLLSTSANGANQEETEKLADDETMLVTAEQELKQQPGVSVITSQDIEKNPPRIIRC